jgi:hypothetical protein
MNQPQDVGIVPTRVVWDSERVRQMRSALDNASLRLEAANPLRSTHMALDEVEFRTATKNLLVLIEEVSGESTKAALKVIAHLVLDLNERHNDLVQQLEDDE